MASDTALAHELEKERKLVEKAQAGDVNALRPIFERYADPLYSAVLLPRLGDPATAEDVLRETFLAALEKIDSFVWQGKSIYAWIRQIAVNKVTDVHRRSQRTTRLARALAHETPGETLPEHAVDAQLIAQEERARNAGRIATTLGELSPRYREVIELRLVKELPREACAEAMNVKLAHFDVLLFRAVRSFRKHFGDRNEDS